MATGGTNVFTQVQDNRVHLFRLQMLIIDGGLLVLRNILDQSLIVQGITFVVCLNQERSKINKLKRGGIITQAQYDLLFPPGGTVPSTSDIDITLMIVLLRNLQCVGFNKSFDWSKQPAPSDVSIEADICRLKSYRNYVSHISTTTGIQQNDFINWWNDIEQLLIRQSSPALNIQQAIYEFKTCPLEPEEETRIQEEIERWKDYEADVERLKGDMEEVKKNVGNMTKNMSNLTKNVDDLKENMSGMKIKYCDIEESVEEMKRKQVVTDKAGTSAKTEEENYQELKKRK